MSNYLDSSNYLTYICVIITTYLQRMYLTAELSKMFDFLI
jgi:hypothetical protein